MSPHGTSHLANPKGLGSFKKRTRLRKRDGKTLTFFEGYVYARDGRKVYGSGLTMRKAMLRANDNLERYELTLAEAARRVIEVTDGKCSSTTLGERLSRYIDGRVLGLPTRRKYRYFAKTLGNSRYFSKDLGGRCVSLADLPMASIETDDLEDFLLGYQRHWSERSTYNLCIFLRQVFKHAFKKRWIACNVAADLERRRKTKKQRIPMTANLMNQLIDVCDHPQLKAFLLLSSYALRAGEATGLTARSIIGPSMLRIEYTQAWMDNDALALVPSAPESTLGLSEPKSEHGARIIELDPCDWHIIERSLEDAIDDSVLTYDLGRRSERFIVCNSHGGQWRTDHVRRALRRWLETIEDETALKWGANLPHNWRVSVITNLIDGDEEEEGMSLAKVSRFAGHSRSEITADVYYKSTRKSQILACRAVSAKRRKWKQGGGLNPEPA